MPWIGLGLGFIALVIMYLDRSALSYAIKPIEADFGFSHADFGLISSAFGFGYIISIIGGGVLADRYGVRLVWTLFACTWSIACILLGFATGFWGFVIFRMLLGLAEAPSFPAFTRMIVDWFPVAQRGRAFALGSSAVAFSSVIGAPITSYLIIYFGWRLAFIALGALGIIWAIIWYCCYRDAPRLPVQKTQSARITPTTWKFLLSNPSLLTNYGAFFVFAYVQFFALVWLPGYLQQIYHLSLQKTAWFLIVPWITAGIFLLLGGFLSDWLLRKTQRLRVARSHVIWTCQLLSGLCFLGVIHFHSVLSAIVLLSLGLGFNNMPAASLGLVNADLAEDRAATSIGIMNFAFGVAAIISPILTGFFATWTGNFNVAIFLMTGLIAVSVLGIICWHHPDRSG